MARVLRQTNTGAVADRVILIRFMVLIGLAVLVGSVWAGWHFVYSNPRRVFWAAVENNLQTFSVVKTNSSNGGGEYNKQQLQAFFSPKHLIMGHEAIQVSGDGGYAVVRDEMGSPNEDYVRYASIKTDQKNQDGKPVDYKNVIGAWAKSESGAASAGGQLYQQMALSIVPYGNLPPSQRKELLTMMEKSVYTPDYGAVDQTIKDHRPVYTYSVKVNAEAYITMLKKYASFVGLKNLDQTDPAEFHDAAPVAFKMDVDVWTRQIHSFTYADGRQDRYDGYGVALPKNSLPTNTITATELQKRIQSAR